MIDARLRTVRTRPATCPGCFATISAASSAEGVHPTPGDLTVCLYCATVLAFTAALGLRRATPADFDELTDEARATLARYRATVDSMIRSN